MTANTKSSHLTGRVLLIEDDPVIHTLVAGILKSLNLTVVSRLNAHDGIECACEGDVQLILLDNTFSDGTTGLAVLKTLKENEATAAIPVIMVTGEERNSVLTSCFAAGAIDYLRKPFAAAELRARVNSVLERQHLLAELTGAATLDRLTGLANRATLNHRLDSALARTKLEKSYGFAVMFLDFDRFKFVNDTLGHDVGDLLLQAIAGRLLHNLRATGGTTRGDTTTTVARLGGDEFVVILGGVTTIDEAEHVGARLLHALEAPYNLKGNVVRSTASIGTALSGPSYALATEMLRDADAAMYEAKARGKARHVIFSQTMRDAVRESEELEFAFRGAVSDGQIHVEFQPIVSLHKQYTWAVEALARWTHPTRGAIGPEVFIPMAEQMNVIVELTDYVLHSACATFRALMRSNIDPVRGVPEFLSVNVSHTQLGDSTLAARILAILACYGLRADQLQIEISETALLRHKPTAVAAVKGLRAVGIRVAMDNFGARESSLSCLQEFPVVSVKVNRSLIANAIRSRDFAALLHAVITLAENLGYAVVAEGVETAEQVVLLQAMGCEYAQGFHFARPMRAVQLLEYFAASPLPADALLAHV